MTIRQLIVAYLASALSLLALDAVWLTLMADRLYRPAIGHLMAERFSLVPALVFYAVYIAGVVGFAVAPGLAARRWTVALGRGAFLGLMAYGTYDLTNQATLLRWPWLVTFADLAWGAFLTAVAAAVGARVAMAWGRNPSERRPG
ncbi:DUF2177 family protein [Variovorax sp. GT1P44]|uniref:DUF2177 family protein n=1 Tax=Variovorax sp. GT1P44 TaxID=3443742 RepID=UPI003F458997